MSNQAESNYFSPILSALASIGAIITAISPIIINNSTVSLLFVDRNVILFSSVISLLIVIITIWLLSSIRSYSLFNNQDQEKIKLRFILFFIFSSLSFYSSKIFADSHVLQKGLASVMQVLSYLSSFFFLSGAVGLILRDSYQGFRYQKIEDSKLDRTRESIIKSGIVNIDLKIISLTKHQFVQGQPIDWLTANNVTFINQENEYRGILSNDYSNLLICEKIKKPVPEKEEK